MLEALALAKKAMQLGETPVGAVIVKKSTGEIIGRGYNLREGSRSALSHAETIAIDQASRTLGGWRLLDSVIYVTLEPCPMCAGAIINARLDRVVFGAFDPKAGSFGSVVSLHQLPYNHRPEVVGGVLCEKSAELLKDFFSSLRSGKREKKQIGSSPAINLK